MASDIKVTLETEPIVKLLCFNRKCRYNMTHNVRNGGVFCTLKWVEIDENGKCRMEDIYLKDHDNPTP